MANSPFCCLSAHRRFKKKKKRSSPPPPPGTPARRDGTLFCRLTFLTAVIVEDVVTQSAPTLLPVRAEEAVICGDRRRLVCFKEKKTQAIVQVKAHGGCGAAWTSTKKPLDTFCICQFSVIFVLRIRCSHFLLYLYSIERVQKQGALTLSALLKVSSFKHRRQLLGCHCWRLLSIWTKIKSQNKTTGSVSSALFWLLLNKKKTV